VTKHYSSGRALHEKLLEGINDLADNVASTLGPRGRNVILHKEGHSPIVTKDGVTVANFINFDDPIKNVGAEIIKQAASNTNVSAGDGTTTSTVLSRAILQEAQKYLVAGSSPVELKRGMDKTVEAIVGNIKGLSRPVETQDDIRHVATISANNDKTIGDLITMAVDQAGKDGAISVEDGKSMETTLDVVEGFRFDSGYFSKSFITNQRKAAIKYDSPVILITDHKIDSVDSIYPVLELAARDGRPLIVVAEEVEGQALAALIMNSTRGTMKVAAVKAPYYGEERRNTLKDLSVSVGATFISRESGIRLSDVKLDNLGTCDKIEVIKNHTTVVGGRGDVEVIEEKIESLKEEIKQTEDMRECEKIQERITRLASGVAIIRVGGATEVEMIEKKHRIEDALEAVKSAQEEGMVSGGGVTLLRAAQEIDYVEFDNDDQRLGKQIILSAIEAPLRQMAINCGLSPDLIVEKVLASENEVGYNFVTNEMTDLFEAGVIDPAKVTRTALQNATSVSSTLVTTNYAVIEQ
jgi:chaperonin GroEL